MIGSRLVIFDGVCNFCNGSINFIIKRDSSKKYSFTPMQSEAAQQLITRHQIENVGVDTFLLLKNERCYIGTNAALEIARDLDGYWYLFGICRIIPHPIRDYLYRLFARNRYALFGQTEQCMIPDQNVRDRFIGLD